MIIFLSELYYPETTSTGYLITKIAEELAQTYPVQVITGPPTKLFVTDLSFPTYELHNEVRIWRCNGTSFDKNKLLGNSLNFLSRSLSIFWKALCIVKKNEIIFVVTFSPILPLFSVLLKFFKGIILIPIIYDVYPDALIATGVCKPDSFVVKIIQKINYLIYRQSDAIVVIGNDMKYLIHSKFKSVVINKLVEIPNWAFSDLIQPQLKIDNILLKKLNLDNKFVVLYAGNMGRTHDLEIIIEAAKKLNTDTSIHFLISGYGYKKKKLTELIEQCKVVNVTILDSCPQSQLNQLLNACDVAIISLVPNMSGISVPSRMYNHMASAKPVIAIVDESSELARLIYSFDIGWVVAPKNIQQLIETIQLAKVNPSICCQKSINSFKLAKNYYTFERVIASYLFLIQLVFERKIN